MQKELIDTQFLEQRKACTCIYDFRSKAKN